MSLFVLSGKSGIGKTTCLEKLCQGRNDIGGFLSPIVNGKRNFYLISQQKYVEMEANEVSFEDILKIRKYTFSKLAFDEAISALQMDWSEQKRICILDEFGPLEKDNTGLLPELNEIIKTASKSEQHDLIVVVRESLRDHFVSKYMVTKVFNVENVKNLFEVYY